MLDMGFIHDVRKIVGACSKDRQTLLFSATMPPSIAKLAHDILREPVRIDISRSKVAVDRVAQSVYFVGAQDKRTLLTDLLKAQEMGQAIVFTRTKRGADRVCRHLVQNGLTAEALHGNKAQNARVRTLNGFRSGKVRVLVATDIAARGIDVPGISHVINYELPNEPESYVHRIGRTARAGAQGIALSLCDNSERPYLKAIERLMRTNVEIADHRLAVADATPAPEPRRSAPASKPARRRRRYRGGRPNGAAPAPAKSSNHRRMEAPI
jgi:ATP-dependent RNA helicase RhlE